MEGEGEGDEDFLIDALVKFLTSIVQTIKLFQGNASSCSE